MLTRPLNELIPVLQVAIGPVILISGISLLLLTLTNRFGRTIDRSRQLVHELRESPANEQQLSGQVEILYRRARLIRLSIITAAAGLLLASAFGEEAMDGIDAYRPPKLGKSGYKFYFPTTVPTLIPFPQFR
jgi:hypothetical protein